MAGIYIHIPFCMRRCSYCGFYSTTMMELRQQYIEAVCSEWHQRKNYLHNEPVRTIYIGGGTPSTLTPQQLGMLMSTLPTMEAKEITIECNPDDVMPSWATALQSLPINRVSMGVQTFDDARLRFIGRRHTTTQPAQAIHQLRTVGIKNISIDLMYGFPEQTLKQWQQDVETALKLKVEHLSAYALTIEENTLLHRLVRQGVVKEIDEELSRDMYEWLIDRVQQAGYEQYELSNFALPNYYSRHNSSYWQQIPYLGLGAAAHSFDKKSRQWNVADVKKYIDAIAHMTPSFEYEELNEDSLYNELIMTSLRTSRGLNIEQLTPHQQQYCLQMAQKYLTSGLLQLKHHQLRLTRKGLFVSDMVMCDLMRA